MKTLVSTFYTNRKYTAYFSIVSMTAFKFHDEAHTDDSINGSIFPINESRRI